MFHIKAYFWRVMISYLLRQWTIAWWCGSSTCRWRRATAWRSSTGRRCSLSECTQTSRWTRISSRGVIHKLTLIHRIPRKIHTSRSREMSIDMRTGGDGESRGFMAVAWAAQRGDITFHLHLQSLVMSAGFSFKVLVFAFGTWPFHEVCITSTS